MPTILKKSEIDAPRVKSGGYEDLGLKIDWNFRSIFSQKIIVSDGSRTTLSGMPFVACTFI